MAEQPDSGVLDTCAYLDLGQLDPAALPKIPEITAVTMAELQQGLAMAKGWPRTPLSAAARTEKLGAAIASVRELPLYTRNAADFRGLADLVEVIAV